MNGRIKKYFPDKGFGFIQNKSGEEYFFHISNMINSSAISIGEAVEFDDTDNEKGKLAININVIETKKFVIIGNKRVKISNIKEYKKSRRLETNAMTAPGVLWDLASSIISRENKVTKYMYKLHIKTYQNDSIVHTADEHEIDSIINELDNM